MQNSYLETHQFFRSQGRTLYKFLANYFEKIFASSFPISLLINEFLHSIQQFKLVGKFFRLNRFVLLIASLSRPYFNPVIIGVLQQHSDFLANNCWIYIIHRFSQQSFYEEYRRSAPFQTTWERVQLTLLEFLKDKAIMRVFCKTMN
ncbi:hypothetical protein Tlet_1367 [Pseudothermotoga lettingae TMO]|uniref:Uncharacterized protein n=1 Tax=Pseudothermotoga lettingae (strain ATCC BAA-301 / DSM 14385 / NBRC 107922 / TMO) TaxID=416591 RepID=A8F6Z0_PSELT|nr:hypothetical protein Tlet_1367 [Pseudothermotoga lettingae TMO]KUK21946.1 MAG: Uncharacterized protein XD56_0133 [Pseudothermotoga lettingae]MDK2884243.1 hypothetical protein [Pseudothermotoga sp.]HBJ81768.1 hypothetical protein [Pseudothermotoga sp.]